MLDKGCGTRLGSSAMMPLKLFPAVSRILGLSLRYAPPTTFPHSRIRDGRDVGILVGRHCSPSHGLALWEADREGVWMVHRGMLRAELPDAKQERSFLYAGSEDWVNYALDFDAARSEIGRRLACLRDAGGG